MKSTNTTPAKKIFLSEFLTAKVIKGDAIILRMNHFGNNDQVIHVEDHEMNGLDQATSAFLGRRTMVEIQDTIEELVKQQKHMEELLKDTTSSAIQKIRKASIDCVVMKRKALEWTLSND